MNIITKICLLGMIISIGIFIFSGFNTSFLILFVIFAFASTAIDVFTKVFSNNKNNNTQNNDSNDNNSKNN